MEEKEISPRSLRTIIADMCMSRGAELACADGLLSFTYRQLDSFSNDIYVQCNDAGLAGAVICLAIPSSARYIASVLSIVKLRGVFVPIDLAWPEERIRAILAMIKPAAIFVEKDQLSRFEGILAAVNLSCFAKPICDEQLFLLQNNDSSKHNDLSKSWTNDSLYLISTSGSTGVPNIVEGKHLSLSHFINWQISTFGIDSTCRVSLLAPTTFDVSLRDIFLPLCTGGTVFVPPPKARYHPVNFPMWVQQNKINLIHTVPSVFKMAASVASFKHSFASVEKMFLSGEKLYVDDAAIFYDILSPAAQLYNLYGPTESTLVKTYYEVPRDLQALAVDIVPIGHPIADCEVLIEKAGDDQCGEIILKSKYLSQGYYKNNQLTAERFVNFDGDAADVTCYKSGDLGYYDNNGLLHIVGRNDSQVKVAGNRVELNEIEVCLRKFAGIDDVIVLAYTASEQDHEPKICCVVTSSKGIKENEIRDYLREQLPSYLVPSSICEIPAFPLLPNGKKDRKKLLSMVQTK
ncbi:AMP-binding protein [Thalassolituus maritimus]|nr:AMP-binding protein [Thalassolituus maritimus]